MKNFLRRLIAALCVSCLLVTGAFALSTEEAVDLLEKNYVGELPPAVYEAATLDELFAALGDPYTYYMDAKDYEDFTSGVESEQSVTGIGASIEYTANGILLLGILDGGGAQEAGLVPGDLVVAIDGVPCAPADERHRELIVGEAGTAVTLTVRHADGSEGDYRIVRRVVQIHNTTVSFRDGVVTIDCDSFGSQTGDYFTEGIARYADDAALWVVDLRNNTGGLAGAATTALSDFIGAGPHLYFRNRAGQYSAQFGFNDRLTEGKPVVTLVNGYSASASEVFAGGVRAYGLGIILGSRTYGKGTAQLVFDKETNPELFDGDSLKVTAYRFFSPDGNTSDKIGVVPTLLVDDAYTAEIRSLLAVNEPAGDRLRFTLAGWTFYVDLADARKNHLDALRELLSALPPDVAVHCTVGDLTLPLDPELAARYLELDVPSRRFTDVALSPFGKQINTLGVYRILRGSGDGTFHPSGTLTRAELCAMLAQALDVESTAGGNFSDVPDGRWFASPVNAMAQLGLVQGNGKGQFLPDGTLTQQEFFTVLGRLAAYLNFNAHSYYTEADADALSADAQLSRVARWARAETATLDRLLVDGDGAQATMLWTDLASIDPKAPITREQAAATLCNMLTMLGMIVY